MQPSKTIFEKIISKEVHGDILFEDDSAIILRDVNPQAPTHVLIIPKKRIHNVSAMHTEDAALIGHLILLAKYFAEKNKLKSFRLVMNNGIEAGESVPHLHIHLLSGRPMMWPPG